MTDQTTLESSSPENRSKHPNFSMKLGNISVAIFTNDKKSSSGEVFQTQDIVLEKSWKQADGSYDSRKMTLDPKDIMNVNVGLTQAYLEAYRLRNS